jgi:polysaccharide export outer membrane protein
LPESAFCGHYGQSKTQYRPRIKILGVSIVVFFERIVVLVVGLLLMSYSAVGYGQADGKGYQIKPGDVLGISVWGEEQLQGTALVTPDGGFSFPLVGHLNARGKSAEEVQEIVRDRLRNYLSDPVVTVSLQEINGSTIYVIGQVNNPGEFVMKRSVDVMQALSMAGGTTTFASLNDILILRREPSEQIALPFRYSDIIRGRSLDQNIELQSGDVVVVP